ncbi:MAG: Ycf66 family protein [Waterburya sp.]
MLSYALAIAVAISSLILFSTAFLMSKIHRKDDFLWGAVGLFYALVLWYCARNITGTVLLGQAAASVLVVSYSWQIIKLRRVIINPTQATETNSFSLVRSINNLWQRKKPQGQSAATPMTKAPIPKVTEENIAIPETPAEIAEQTNKVNRVTTVARDTNSKDVNVSDVQDKADNYENQVSQPSALEPLPLPNKLPEISQVDKIKISQAYGKSEAEQETPENIPAARKTEDFPETISQEILDKTSEKEGNPNPEKVTEETAKSPNPKSALDSLETVEVAEVLEAESDRPSNDIESDRFNIIEVTTTEVSVTKKIIKPDQNQDHDADLEDFT